jgi:tRNA pseudouridine38-40 synthase
VPRLKLTLAYEGTRYAGWQIQAPPHPPTVQGALEYALARMAGHRIPVLAAGRTDAGVHAEAQVCHLDLPEDRALPDLLFSLNALLPPDIRVLDAIPVASSFHARRDALGKCYAYSLWSGRRPPPPRVRAFVWHTENLDCARMAEAAWFLEGRRDFASFRNKGGEEGRTVRTLRSLSLQPGGIGPLLCPEDWPALTLVFEGDGFLKQMVRNLVGFLVFVGRNKLSPAEAPGILAARDRRALPSPTAPACGLTLMRILYACSAGTQPSADSEQPSCLLPGNHVKACVM